MIRHKLLTALLFALLLSSSASAAVGGCDTAKCIYLPMIGASGNVGPAPEPSETLTPGSSATTTTTTTAVATETTATTATTTASPTETTPATETPPTTTPTAPTASATVTPTASATITPTASATVTPTASATITPTSDPNARVTATGSGNTPIYETFELTLSAPKVTSGRFTKFASVTFTQGTRSFAVDGFYDGDNIWRARFMPDAVGLWSYSWNFDSTTGSGSFTALPKANTLAHGHVKVSTSDKRDLVYDDGTPHYWYGSKWFNGMNYGPASKFNAITGKVEINNHTTDNNDPISDAQILAFLDDVKKYKMNGILLKIGMFPLENDKTTWDLPWVRRADFIVREAAKRGIYVQLNIFDTWMRDRNTWFEDTIDGNLHVFNVWKDGDDAAKQNYMRTIVARFAGYYNVYWELGNEMSHPPNGNDTFVPLATKKYVPWLRQYDPYDLPVGLSEPKISYGVSAFDIVHAHRGWDTQRVGSKQAWIANELFASWTENKMLSRDSEVRDPQSRLGYRRTFWRQFTAGSNGSSMSSWLVIKNWTGESASAKAPVYKVMQDAQRLREFLEALPGSINDMDAVPSGTFVTNGGGGVDIIQTRARAGRVYVTYFLVNKQPGDASYQTDPNLPDTPAEVIGKTASASQVTVALPTGASYKARWYDPKTGVYTDAGTVAGGSQTIARPAMVEDLVLLITRV